MPPHHMATADLQYCMHACIALPHCEPLRRKNIIPLAHVRTYAGPPRIPALEILPPQRASAPPAPTLVPTLNHPVRVPILPSNRSNHPVSAAAVHATPRDAELRPPCRSAHSSHPWQLPSTFWSAAGLEASTRWCYPSTGSSSGVASGASRGGMRGGAAQGAGWRDPVAGRAAAGGRQSAAPPSHQRPPGARRCGCRGGTRPPRAHGRLQLRPQGPRPAADCTPPRIGPARPASACRAQEAAVAPRRWRSRCDAPALAAGGRRRSTPSRATPAVVEAAVEAAEGAAC